MKSQNNFSFLNITKNLYLKSSSVIGIFDLDSSTVSKSTRIFLRKCQEEKKLISVSSDIPKSFIITKDNDEEKVYFVQFSSSSLAGRNQ